MNPKSTTLTLMVAAGVAILMGCRPPAQEADSHDHAAQETGGHDHEGDTCGKDGICPEHNVAADECGICNPEKIGTLKPGDSLALRLPSEKSVAVAGVTTAKTEQGTASEAIECYAEFAFDQDRFAQIAAPVGGVVQEVLAGFGSKVTDKQVVARIWSAQIAEAVAKAVLTHQTLERERKLRSQQVTSEKDLQEAEAAHRAACQGLRTYGFTEAQVDGFAEKPQEAVLLDARAPFAGEIIGRVAVRGTLVEAGAPLFTIADRSVMWAELAVPEAELPRLQEGQTVELTTDTLPGRMFQGKLIWISAELDETTRMVRARAEVPNPDGLIKGRMFAKARILTKSNSNALLVPSPAIQQVDGKPFLFIKRGADLFDARAVRVGSRTGDLSTIVEGLRPGEEVATDHAFVLKSQLLISRLGAGCADD